MRSEGPGQEPGVGIGRREDEEARRWRLFEGLEQRVEGLLRQHVHLVDQVHLVASAQRHVGRLVAQLADVVDPRVGGGVDLDQVDLAAGVGGQAALALAAKSGNGFVLKKGSKNGIGKIGTRIHA